jgi:membrane-bound lytic murein transglycosylase D
MERTISKNHILTLFLSLAITLIVGGCASIPETPPPPTASPSVAATSASATLPENAAPKGMAVAAVAEQPMSSEVAAERVMIEARQAAEVETELAETADTRDDTEAADAAANQPANQAEAIQDVSIWDRIRAGLRLPQIDNELTKQHEQWFIENAEFRQAMFDRARLYLYYIVEEVHKRGMPMEIALLPAIESAYKPYAYSRARASGLWQFIPSTGRLYGLKRNWWYDGRRDVVASTRAALDYLQKLHDDFNGDWQLALAAYNAGEGRVMRAVEWNRRRGLPTDFVHLRRLKRETRHYVPKLMAMVHIVSDPQHFGIQLPDIPNEPYFARVEADSQVDLGVIARLTGMEVDELHFINPGYIRRATDPNGPHHILVPVDKKEAVVAGLNELPEDQRVQWLHHRVRRGDTLYDIARHYHLTVRAIKTANRLRGNLLHIGQSLMLPISASTVSTRRSAGAKAVRIAAGNTGPIIHRVRRGETLTSIARRYNVLVRQLAEWNFMRPNDILHLGRRLKIWINGGPQALRHDPSAVVYT